MVSPLGKQPPPQHEQFPNGEKRPQDRLVVSAHPKPQVDVKIVRAILCVAACKTSQRATAPVHREDSALDPIPARSEQPPSETDAEHQRRESPLCIRQRRAKSPCARALCLPGRNSFRLGFHKKPQFRRFIESMGNNFEVPLKERGQVDATRC